MQLSWSTWHDANLVHLGSSPSWALLRLIVKQNITQDMMDVLLSKISTQFCKHSQKYVINKNKNYKMEKKIIKMKSFHITEFLLILEF